jgi:RHS repeat-associated protein
MEIAVAVHPLFHGKNQAFLTLDEDKKHAADPAMHGLFSSSRVRDGAHRHALSRVRSSDTAPRRLGRARHRCRLARRSVRELSSRPGMTSPVSGGFQNSSAQTRAAPKRSSSRTPTRRVFVTLRRAQPASCAARAMTAGEHGVEGTRRAKRDGRDRVAPQPGEQPHFGLTPCPGCAPGRLSTIVDPSGVTLDMGYDGTLLSSLTWSGAISGSVSFAHDNSFRVTSEVVTAGSSVSPVFFGYDPDDIVICASPSTCSPAGGDALKITLNGGNGLMTGSTLGVVTDCYGYNGFGEMASHTAKVGSTTIFSEVADTASHPRDALGRIVERIETNGGSAVTRDYSYDTRGRLTDIYDGATLVEHYGYDPNGNRVLLQTPSSSVTGVYDAQDRLSSYGSATYTYTANGELWTKTDASGTTTYTHDVRGNLIEVDLPSGDVIQYLVDGQDRRVGRKKNGVLEKQWIFRNQLNPVAELDGAGNLISRFVYAAKSNVPEYMVRGGVTYRVVSDHLGSPRAIVDVASGSVVWRADYDAWGNRSLISGTADFVPFGFAGGIFDNETGLVRFGARDYDSTTGRWMAKDPTRFLAVEGQWLMGEGNLYEYARSDPVNHVDRRGRQLTPGGEGGPGFDPNGGAGGAPGAGPPPPFCSNESSRRKCYNTCLIITAVCIWVYKRDVEFCLEFYEKCLKSCDDTTPPEPPNYDDPYTG